MVDRKGSVTRPGRPIERPPRLEGPKGKGFSRDREEVVRRYRQRLEEVEAEVEQVCAESSDRAQILLGCVMIERRLDRLIADRVPEGTKLPRNPTLKRKVEMGLALGVVSQATAKTIGGLAEVRNKAAHRLDANSFSDPLVEKLCKQLEEPNAETTRDQYLWSVHQCCLNLDTVWAVVSPIEAVEPNFEEDDELRALGFEHAGHLFRTSLLGMIKDAEKEDSDDQTR